MAMSTAERNHYGSFVPDDYRDAIHRRLREFGGLALIIVAGAAAAALASWSVSDPSFSHATSAPVRNLLGAYGAITADLAMQLFGLAALAIILPPALWGWRLTSHRILDSLRWRFLAWLIGLVLAAAFASCLPRAAHWPLPSGLGGVIGDALLRVVASVTGGPLQGTTLLVFQSVLGVLGFASILIASGVGIHRRDADEEEAEEGGGSVSIGWFVHTFMSLKARVARTGERMLGGLLLFRRERQAQSLRRAEPQLNGDTRDAFEPAPDADEEEEVEEGEPEGEAKPRQARKPRQTQRQSRKSTDGYELPALNLLAAPKASDRSAPSMDAIRECATALEHVLSDFGVRGEIINARPGPVVTLYELEPAPGVKSSRVIGLSDDIARSMSALSARVAVVPGRNVIGIELPNQTRETVYLRELLGRRRV